MVTQPLTFTLESKRRAPYRFVFSGKVTENVEHVHHGDRVHGASRRGVLLVQAGGGVSRISGSLIPLSDMDCHNREEVPWLISAIIPHEACQALYTLPDGAEAVITWTPREPVVRFRNAKSFEGIDLRFLVG
jgi:hypothetical protein